MVTENVSATRPPEANKGKGHDNEATYKSGDIIYSGPMEKQCLFCGLKIKDGVYCERHKTT